MKPHPRIRKTIKWGGAAVTVLLVVVAIQTLHEFRTWQSGSGAYFGVGGGVVFIGRGGVQPAVRPVEYIAFMPEGSFSASYWWIAVPLWMVAASVLAGTAATCWITRQRRNGVNRCPACNYDRTGLAPGVVCPECGSTPT